MKKLRMALKDEYPRSVSVPIIRLMNRVRALALYPSAVSMAGDAAVDVRVILIRCIATHAI